MTETESSEVSTMVDRMITFYGAKTPKKPERAKALSDPMTIFASVGGPAVETANAGLTYLQATYGLHLTDVPKFGQLARGVLGANAALKQAKATAATGAVNITVTRADANQLQLNARHAHLRQSTIDSVSTAARNIVQHHPTAFNSFKEALRKAVGTDQRALMEAVGPSGDMGLYAGIVGKLHLLTASLTGGTPAGAMIKSSIPVKALAVNEPAEVERLFTGLVALELLGWVEGEGREHAYPMTQGEEPRSIAMGKAERLSALVPEAIFQVDRATVEL